MLHILIANCFLLLLGTVTDEKWKLPSEKEQEKANQVVRELFKEEFASSVPTVKAELAIKLFNIANDTNDDPAGKYVLLREAALLAADNNVPLTLRACDELIKRYEGTKTALLEPLLKKATSAVTKPDTFQNLASYLMKHVDESMLNNDSESATQLHALVEQMGQGAKNEKLVKAIFAQGKYLASFKKSLEKYQQASKKLQAQPNDPEACLLVGQHACFFNGDWAKGLPLLAKSTDPKVKLAATKDLEAHDNDVTSRLAAADAWYDVLTLMDPYSRKLLSQRIQSAYTKLIVSTSGLTKLKIEHRLAEIGKAELGKLESEDIRRSAFWSEVKSTIQNKTFDVLKPVGGVFADREYVDLPPEGGILIGFNYTLKPFGDKESIDGFQAIYLTESGEKLGTSFGIVDQQRMQTLKAKPGYAIGRMAIRGGGLWGGVNVKFLRMDGKCLKLSDSYESGWIGHKDQPDSPFLGDGRVIIGIHGKLQKKQKDAGICSIGLYVLPSDNTKARLAEMQQQNLKK